MNCESVRRQLLLSDSPERPGPDARLHLRRCKICRRWQTRMANVEQAVRRIPVPHSDRREAMVLQFLRTGRAAPPARPMEQPLRWLVRLSPTTAWTWWHGHDARWRALASGGLAAGLLFFTLVILFWGPDDPGAGQMAKKKPATDPFLAKVLDRDVRLAAARTPVSRLEILADLADDLQIQARTAAAANSADHDLPELAQLYQQVLQDGILVLGRKLPLAQRQPVLGPMTDRLARISVETDEIAAGASELSAVPFRMIADAARETSVQLRQTSSEAFWNRMAADLLICTVLDLPNSDSVQIASPIRSRSLIRELVLGGLRLAAEDDPLPRADFCRSLLERLVAEIQQSAAAGEADRVVQLAEHLQHILKHGIAGNLRVVRFESTTSSTRETDVQRIGAQARETIALLEKSFSVNGQSSLELRRALRYVREGIGDVERVLRTPRNHREGDPAD